MRLPAAVLTLLALARPTGAFPYGSLRPIDSAFHGPTDGGTPAIATNPAAMRLGRGFRVEVLAGVQGWLGAYQRRTPLPAGFSPGGAAGPAPEAPIRWALPGHFIGGSWDLGTESVVIGAGVYTPYSDGTTFAASEEEAQQAPTRYHALADATYSLWGSVGAALRVTSWLYLGGSFNFAWTRTRRTALRDPDPDRPDGLPCADPDGCERWERRQILRLDLSEWSFGFSAGGIIVPDDRRLWISAAMISTMFFRDRGALSGLPPSHVSAESACLMAPLAEWRGAAAGAGATTCYGGAELAFAFPWLVSLGARHRLDLREGRFRPSNLDLHAQLRLAIPGRDNEELRLERRALGTLGLPGALELPNGAQTAVAVELGVRELWPRAQLAQSVFYESPRARAEAVSPANVQGHRLDLSLGARVSLHRTLGLLVSVGATAVIVESGAGARFDPGWAAACRASGYDVLTDACHQVQDGWAQPPAAGSYRLIVPHGAAGIELKL